MNSFQISVIILGIVFSLGLIGIGVHMMVTGCVVNKIPKPNKNNENKNRNN